ncbi:hypothetical protein XELAEV_18011463mg [Xenopus laevis]|uniref:Uncharacterized protein n=1 Tax=Xenopus laevis TaxID=8355 RepID=A0A974DND1_XENLA|nr:hypothetical protein XELAEV_18011463mg [Xenopus laevis]
MDAGLAHNSKAYEFHFQLNSERFMLWNVSSCAKQWLAYFILVQGKRTPDAFHTRYFTNNFSTASLKLSFVFNLPVSVCVGALILKGIVHL